MLYAVLRRCAMLCHTIPSLSILAYHILFHSILSFHKHSASLILILFHAVLL